jgi:esterase/lipase superfamily enzyme
VQQAVANSETKELVLFIHGYNVDFAGAIKSAGQLTFDTAQDYYQLPPGERVNQRAAIAFDWASCGGLANYGFVPWENDRVRAEQAAPKLAELLADLATHVSPAESVPCMQRALNIIC